MHDDYKTLTTTIYTAYIFTCKNDIFRREMLAESGAAEYVGRPNKQGDIEITLTYKSGRELTLIVMIIEIADLKAGEVPKKLRKLFMKRLHESLPVVRN